MKQNHGVLPLEQIMNQSHGTSPFLLEKILTLSTVITDRINKQLVIEMFWLVINLEILRDT
jgi:hypothetical protein